MPSTIKILTWLLIMVNFSAMSKEQAKEHLRTLGEEAHPKWTSLEIKSRIKELTERDQQKGLGVNSNSTKAEIEQKCREKGLTVTKNDTKGSLLRKLRAAQDFEEKGSDETMVGFGRHADKKYKEVPQTYLDWAMEVCREGPTECSGKLARLASWAMTQQGKPEESADEKNLEPTAISSVASSAGVSVTTGRSRKKPRSPEMAEDAESGQAKLEQKMEQMMGQMMAGMQQLQTRMIDLEQKQPTNPDETMPKEPTPSQESFKMVYSWPADCRE